MFTDGRRVAAGGCGGAEATESVGGVDLDISGQFGGDSTDRMELSVGELVGVLGAEQVGAAIGTRGDVARDGNRVDLPGDAHEVRIGHGSAPYSDVRRPVDP